jgi:HEAT repeat protein
MKSLLTFLFPQVRSSEHSRFAFFLLLSLLLNLAQTTGLVLSESLLLARLGPAALPVAFVGSALATVFGSLLYALGVHRAKNDRYFIRLLAIGAVLIAANQWFLAQAYAGAVYTLMALYFLTQCILTNHYWTFTGDFFDTLSSKRLFPLFVVGSSLGGMLGAGLLAATSVTLSPLQQLTLWPAFLMTCALLLRWSRPHLRRWGPLELEEADETSLAEMKNAANYLRQSPLGQHLVLACASMIGAGFLAQYLYSSLFLQHFPEPAQLSRFLSLLLTVTNGLEIMLEVVVTPWLIRVLGVANANQIHSSLTLASFLAVWVAPGLPSAVALRLTRESLENAIAGPIRSLVYNALPARSRGRVRAFLEGLVTYTAMAATGLLLLSVAGQPRPPAWMYGLGLGVACVYWLITFRVRRSYLDTMISEVEAGRLDLAELHVSLSGSESRHLQRLWRDLTREAPQHPDPSLVRLAKTLSQRNLWALLSETALDAERPIWLRSQCLEALGQPGWTRDWKLLQSCLQAKELPLRLAALGSLGEPRSALAPDWLVSCLQDPEVRVRAQAAAWLCCLPKNAVAEQAHLVLQQMLSSSDPAEVLAALSCAPPLAAPEVEARATRQNPLAIARQAFKRLADWTFADAEQRKHWIELADAAFEHPALRSAALQVMWAHRDLLPADSPRWPAWTEGLADRSRPTRSRTIQLLASRPSGLQELIEPYLHSTSMLTARAAVECLGQSPLRQSRELLQQSLRSRVERLWQLTLITAPISTPLAEEYFRLCLEDARERQRRLIFEILAWLETPKIIRSVEKVLRFTNLRARSDALEVLSNLGDREAAHLLVLWLESGELHEKKSALPQALLRSTDWAHFCGLPWIQGERWIVGALAWIDPQYSGEQPQEEQVERLLVLRKVPLFAQMNLEQLVAIDQRLEEVEYLAGETVFEEGQLGAELYILLDGAVRIVKAAGTDAEVLLTRLEGVNYFGEMAILDDEPRSASVMVERNSRLLVLKGEQLKDLVEQMPEMAFEIIKVLTARIRQADERLKKKS